MQLDGDNSVGKHYHSQVPACATEAGFPGSAANTREINVFTLESLYLSSSLVLSC